MNTTIRQLAVPKDSMIHAHAAILNATGSYYGGSFSSGTKRQIAGLLDDKGRDLILWLADYIKAT